MKEFLLFAGDNYYPEGGAKDFIGGFDDQSEAWIAASSLLHDWYQICEWDDVEGLQITSTGGT